MTERLISLEPPVLGIFIGPPGSGKTTLVERLARIIDCTIICKDDVADSIYRLRDRTYQDLRPEIYRLQDLAVAQRIARRTSVFLDTTLSDEIKKRNWENWYRATAAGHGAILKIIQLIVPVQTCESRMATRGLARDLDKLTPEGWQRFWEEQSPELAILPPDCSWRIENDGDFGLTIIRALDFLTSGVCVKL